MGPGGTEKHWGDTGIVYRKTATCQVRLLITDVVVMETLGNYGQQLIQLWGPL